MRHGKQRNAITVLKAAARAQENLYDEFIVRVS
jgi:hypothetical protein